MSQRLVALVLGLCILPLAATAQDPPEAATRTLYLKLPLAQPEHHWRFHDREAFLSGRLTLRMIRAEGQDSMVVFDASRIVPGWSPIETAGPGEIYFGFTSATRYVTTPSDSVVIELLVREDLAGIGPELSGILLAGSYRSTGSYSGLTDASDVPPRAFLQCWREKWNLVPTGPGWLDPQLVVQPDTGRQGLLAELAEIRARLAELGAGPPAGSYGLGTDGRPCL